MEGKKNRNAAKDFASGILLVLFGIYIIIESLNMKVYNTFIDAPGFFPLIIGIVLTILGAILTLIGFRTGGAGQLKEVLNAKFLKAFATDDTTIRVLILLAMMAVYIYVLVGRMHFILATTIYLVATFLYLKAVKRWWISIIIAVVASVVIYYAFRLGLGITMP